MFRLLFHPLASLWLMTAALACGFSAYLATGHSISREFELLAGAAWLYAAMFWIDADARRRRRVPCFDLPFLCIAFAPASIPWYCLWSRGWRGFRTLGLIVGLWLAPAVVAAAALVIVYLAA